MAKKTFVTYLEKNVKTKKEIIIGLNEGEFFMLGVRSFICVESIVEMFSIRMMLIFLHRDWKSDVKK